MGQSVQKTSPVVLNGTNDTNDTHKLTSDSPNTVTRENRTIRFSIEQLMQVQQDDDYAKNILNNIKNYKNFINKDNLLMRRLNPSIPYVPPGDFRTTILEMYHDTAANGAHFGRDKTLHKIEKR